MAFLGSFGLELDIRKLTDKEQARLSEWITLYKEIRTVLHNGPCLRALHPDPGLSAFIRWSPDRHTGLCVILRCQDGETSVPAPLRLCGADTDLSYALTPLMVPPELARRAKSQPALWHAPSGPVSGAWLTHYGVPVPVIAPGEALVMKLVSTVKETRA